MNQQIRLLLTCLVVAVSSALVGNAQVASGGSFTLEQSVIANGGGVSADPGNTYKVEGTIAQPAAGTLMRQPPYSQTGGFWPAALALAPTAAPARISGRITTADGLPVAGVSLTLIGSNSTRAITDSHGVYSFAAVEVGGFYTVVPAKVNYSFTPANRSFSLLVDQADAAFTATADAVLSANPLDTAEFFVRQQYVDVLGREPDAAGFNFWSDRILDCASDADCIRSRRIAVAAEFFIHQEFQQSGAFIYNLYSGSLSRRPAYGEYAIDRQQVVGGPHLEAEKQAFAESFVQRGEFIQKYQMNSTAAGFVDALLTNLRQTSGAELSSQRDSLIARYNTGANQAESRSFVLRDVTENAAVRDANYNAAFVLTEYFGYLRRDPDQEGYNFWLNVLTNRVPDNYHAMVCAFLTSAEYQQRFSSVVAHTNVECQPVVGP